LNTGLQDKYNIPLSEKDGVVEKEPSEAKWYTRQLTQEEFINFISESLANKENRKAHIGMITYEAHQRIKDVCGKMMSNIMLESGTVRHCINKSSHNLWENDILLIPEIINTATDIQVSDTMNQNNECLEFRKDIDGDITLVVEARMNYGG
jgi:hypothetical protein